MAIEKNSFKLLSTEFSPHSRDTIMLSEDEDFQRPSSAGVGSGDDDDDDDELDDCDSGAGSDDFDLLELGDAGEEFCQVGDQTCSIPYELYDLTGLQDILSLEVWNEILSEEERFTLTQFLPDMDHETFLRTLMELFTGSKLHFGNPVDKLYEMLKGGLCEPRVALYRQGLNFFQKRRHYHQLRKHQNSMVTNLCQMRDAWSSCKGYSIEEKLQVLNIMKSQKSQKSLINEQIEELESESSDRESVDVLWGKRIKDWKLEQRTGRHGSKTPLEFEAKQTATGFYSRQNKRSEEELELFPVSVKRLPTTKAGSAKMGKKHEIMIREHLNDSFASTPWNNGMNAHRRKMPVNQLSDIAVLTSKPSDVRIPRDYGREAKHIDQFQLSAEDQMLFMKGHGSNLSQKGYQMDPAAINDPFFLGRAQGEPYTAEPTHEWDMNRKKGKTGRKSSDVNDRLFPIEYQSQTLLENFSGTSVQNGEHPMGGIKALNDETESDSSEQMEENGDDNPLMRSKGAYSNNISDKKARIDYNKAKISKKDRQANFRGYDGSSNNSKQSDDYGIHQGMRNFDNYGMRVEFKGQMHDGGNFNDNSHFYDDDWQQMSRLGRDGYVQGDYNVMPFKNSRGKSDVIHEYIDPRSNSMRHNLEGEYHLHPGSSARDSRVGGRMGKKGHAVESLFDSRFERHDVQLIGCNSAKKRKVKPDFTHMDEKDDNDYHHSDKQLQLFDFDISKRRGKKKLVIGDETLGKEISELPLNDMVVGEVELDAKPQKKPFILITPTIHTGFSFSIIHLLSSVRIAMITLLPEDSQDASIHHDKIDGKSVEKEATDLNTEGTKEAKDLNTEGAKEANDLNTEGMKEAKDLNTEGTSAIAAPADDNASKPAPSASDNVPSLSVQEIVNRVRSNPGDPCILETQEPLQDLVRGVLKIFLSKTAPLGAKGWKPLVLYEKTSKSWTWSNPVNQNPADEAAEEVTSPEAWGLPHKMLVKLVDAFANWLKNGQETLQQIGSLPEPPLSLTQYTLDDKERFKDLRAQKSLSTISPSSEEVRSYFRKEEVLRYSIPDRTFCYTAIDGKKSIVAPLRRCGGKPTSKARDHFMLKRDRPPHVTILCLVRDAASRLPGSIGTRADVCTLIRDSQYIVEDVSDAQVNQVVSGALDRLHYERDPCVQFDGERKLWAYLHREREEEDFEDDGTSSTKKWKRQKKEATEPDQGVTVAYPGTDEQTQLELSSGPNVETQLMDEDKGPQLMPHDDGKDHIQIEPEHMDEDEDKEADIMSYDDGKDLEVDTAENNHGSDQGSLHISMPVVCDVPGFDNIQENRLLCQENSTNDDFNDEPSGKDAQ